MSADLASLITPPANRRDVEDVRLLTSLDDRPDPWTRQLYDEWVMRLGAERMCGFLATLRGQFRNLLTMLAEPRHHRDDELHRRAHDAASTAGMLGFMDVTRCCRAVLEASDAAAETRARPVLTDALERAVFRLDRHLSADEPRAVAA